MAKITVIQLRLPLSANYSLSFATLSHFDTFLLLFSEGDQDVVSEVTALPGYSWETPEEIWNTVEGWLHDASGSMGKLSRIVEKYAPQYPFAASLINVAMEKILGFWNSKRSLEIPLVGTISSSKPQRASREAKILLKDRYDTIKIKAKGNLQRDLAVIESVQSAARGEAVLRIDANQAYTLETCKKFVDSIDHNGIELLEQPLRKGSWHEMAELRRSCPIPLMLDEDIWLPVDIQRVVAKECADYIKLKLFKQASLQNTLDMIRIARRAGLGIVLGNGVQTEIGCMDEACLHQLAELDNAAECNGFLKLRSPILINRIEFRNGTLRCPCGGKIDWNAVERYSRRVLEWKLHVDVP
jgi:L-alanine-DL-glutamate epimerase-like enolase superfamily enzyme